MAADIGSAAARDNLCGLPSPSRAPGAAVTPVALVCCSLPPATLAISSGVSSRAPTRLSTRFGCVVDIHFSFLVIWIVGRSKLVCCGSRLYARGQRMVERDDAIGNRDGLR